jgi:hypothetical protein
MAPTNEDAQLMVQLAQWGAMIELGQAMGIVFDDDFDPELADSREEGPRTILAYMETIGTMVKNDLLDGDLVRDWIWVDGLWDRVGPAAKRAREAMGEPRLYENFEALTSG